jgi:hypothetical protein
MARNLRIKLHWETFVQPLLQWKSNKSYKLWVCVCSLRYPACNARAPYCYMWPVRLDSMFPHNLINGTSYEKNIIEHKMWVLVLSTMFCLKYFLILRGIQRQTITNVYGSCKDSTCYSLQIFFSFSRQIFEIHSGIKFNENLSSGSRVVTCGQADMTKPNSFCSQFCERALKWLLY